MIRELDLPDIQGNVTRAYGRYHFPFARYFFLHIGDIEAGRKFIMEIMPKVTTAARWPKDARPDVTLNIGMTFFGLMALGLSNRTLRGMPAEYIDGMKSRSHILGDRGRTESETNGDDWCSQWDPVWQQNRSDNPSDPTSNVHLWISMNAQAVPGTDQPVPALEDQTAWLRQVCAKLDHKVQILAGNGKNGDQEYQTGSAIFEELPDGTKVPTAKEHFGFTDGIGDPVFEGQYPPEEMKDRVIGRGKWMDHSARWQPLAAGEFVLGYPDESQELPPSAPPSSFTRNGSFMVYRKLHQNLASFNEVVADEAQTFAKTMNIPLNEANITLRAKMVGRWPDGVPLAVHPTFEAWSKFRQQKGFDDPDPTKSAKALYDYLKSPEPSNFKYADDMRGYKCPGGAHLRRANTRDYLDPLNQLDASNADATTQLNKRRRILRRGLPYGANRLGIGDDDSEQGVIFMTVCASIFRQFEFVQQQWIEYGLDFNAGNNTCPMLGNHAKHKRHVIPSDPKSDKPPYVMSKLKTFVETRGGDYFFIPSLTALGMLAIGSVDPT